MRRTITAASLVALMVTGLAMSVFAEEPFGFELNTHPKSYGYCEQVERDPTFYHCSSAPKPHKAFQLYMLQHVEGIGLCMIKGASVTIDNDAYGIDIRSAADSIYRQVSKKYGPIEKSDFLFSGSIWDEARDWTMGLLKRDRMYSYLWGSKDGFAPVGHVRELGIMAKALSSDSGYILLEYTLTTKQSCDAKIEQTEAGVF